MFALAPQIFRIISIIPASLGCLKTKLFAPELHLGPSIDIWKSCGSPTARDGTWDTSFSLLGSNGDFKYVLLDFGPLLPLSSQPLSSPLKEQQGGILMADDRGCDDSGNKGPKS